MVVFFFFKQKTAYEMRISDWSSDVCSSDLAHAAHHSLHAAHHALHAAAAQLAHHLFHLLVLLHQLVDVGRGHAGAGGDALAARTVEQGRVAALLLRHRIDDRHHPRHFLAGDLRLDVVGTLANARQLVHQPGQAAHVLLLLELVLHRSEAHTSELHSLLRIPYAIL